MPTLFQLRFTGEQEDQAKDMGFLPIIFVAILVCSSRVQFNSTTR